MLDGCYFDKVKGAVYFPSRAYNAYQIYENYDRNEIDRDFGYAESAGLNALRIFTSYEQYQKDGENFFLKFDDLLDRATAHGIRVMSILFENCGVPFTLENALSQDPRMAVCVQSPGKIITDDPARWDMPFLYADMFMRRYRDDSRLLAIEVMNEPHAASGDVPFARALAMRCHAVKGTVPLTMGCITLEDNLFFAEYLDIYQFHDNFPISLKTFRENLEQAAYMQHVVGKPVWLSEWQRLRLSGPGWDVPKIPDDEVPPALATLADIVYSSGLGSFFWCLMIKAAYLPQQRPNGTFNGLFHEDGSLYSFQDFEAIAGKKPVGMIEGKHGPQWFEDEMKRYIGKV